MFVPIVSMLRGIARRQPDAPALTWRRLQWTYRQLDEASRHARDAIAARGLPPGARIALLIRNSPQYVALYYGALAAGCVPVPLNAQERAAVLSRQATHAGISLLIGDSAHPEWRHLTAQVESGELAKLPLTLSDEPGELDRFQAALGRGLQPATDSEPALNDLATIIYTSGTTGRPKGVMLSHGNLAANVTTIIEYLGLTPTDRGLCVLPFHFSYGNSVLHSHLLSGAHLVLEDNFAFPHVTLQRIQDLSITGFSGVPSTYALLLGRCRLHEFNLSSLRYLTQAGGAMSRGLIERLHGALPDVQLFIMYGQTEATARISYLPPSHLKERLGSVGLPLKGVTVKVLGQHGQEQPAGDVGEIHVSGPNVMLGYWRDEAATADVLKDGWLRTGDLGHKDDAGFLYIDGRAQEMIKVGAYRVSPQEVEEVIAAVPGVEEVGVTGVADEMLGQSIKAVIVLQEGAELEARTIQAHCHKQLASYKIPKIVEFAAELPRTSSGKIQRFKLS